jgi:glutamyl-tRNA synthetase
MALPENAEALLRKYALQNAVHHGGKADPKAIVGRVLGSEPTLRPFAKELTGLAALVVPRVNDLPPDAQRKELESLDPRLLERKVKEERTGLKRLPDDEQVAQIVMRFAPNPNGPATLGHSRGMVLHAEYQRMYKEMGKPLRMILRYDDTDPATKKPILEAYHALQEDFEWLGGRADRVLYASDRIGVYYDYAEKLIGLGKAYVCECEQEAFKKLKDAGEACLHRSRTPEENLVAWKRMLDPNGFAPGQAVLRIATDVKHPDPALREWVAFRIVLEPHPRVGTKHRVWPLLDFESAIEDRLQGVTHIVRGKDLIDSERKQTFVYQYFGWDYPKTMHWGRVKVLEFGKISKSLLGEGIASGKFSGWDDVRLPTLAAMRRRGIRPEALRNFWLSLGISERDVEASLANVEAENRKIVEKEANRYFWVEDPQPLEVTELPKGGIDGHAPRHPDHPERGTRRVHLGDGSGTGRVLLAAADVQPGRKDEILRLKDWGNVRLTGTGRAEYAGNDLAVLKAGARIVQWVSADPSASVPVRVLMPDEAGTVRTGVAESDCVRDFGKVVQFERVGFVRLERQERGAILAPFSHE